MRSKIVAVVVLATLAVTGCSTKSQDELMNNGKAELVSMYRDIVVENTEKDVEIDRLKSMLSGIGVSENPTAAIAEMSDGTGRLTFNKVGDKIEFPVPFEYPGSTQAANNSAISIADNVTVSPSANWEFKFDGTAVLCAHPSGISGQIKVGAVKKAALAETLQEEVFLKFFEGFPPDVVSYTKVYIENNWMGMQAKTHTFIDSKDSQIRCGMVGMGKIAVEYIFMYDGLEDITKDELEANIIGTLEIFQQQIRIEN